MESGTWFSIRFITADIKKGSGGIIMEFPKARIARNNLPGHIPFEGRQTNQIRESNHNLNFTRNLQLPNKQIRKVHPILITHINQQQVI